MATKSTKILDPLAHDDERHEVLFFSDGTEIEIDQTMRHDCPEAYARARGRAVSRIIRRINHQPSTNN